MFKVFGNQEAQVRIEKYLAQEKPNSLMIIGEKGIGKCKLATYAASKLLGIDINKLSLHPDYLYISPEGNSIKLSQVEEIQQTISYFPSIASKRIIIIDDADKMSVSSQNYLLKILEDKFVYNIFILVTHNKILPTIHSRVSEIQMSKLNIEEMNEYLRYQNTEEKLLRLFLYTCNGSIGTYHKIAGTEGLQESLFSVIDYFEQYSSRDFNILKLFHIYREKDKESFFDKYKDDILILISLLETIFYELVIRLINNQSTKDSIIKYDKMEDNYNVNEVLQILEGIKFNRILLKSSYSKNDFFNLIRLLI